MDDSSASGILYKPTDKFNQAKTISAKNGEYFELEELQELVGGDIEVFVMEDGRIAIVNADGKFDGLSYNIYGTMATGILSKKSVSSNILLGNVFITKSQFMR